MKGITTLLISLVFSQFLSAQSDLLSVFKAKLDSLDKRHIESIDAATSLFQTLEEQSDTPYQMDSLFMPYFEFYNLGRTLLLNKEDSIIQHYGFLPKEELGKRVLVPGPSAYLSDNIIVHLSRPMKEFCMQNLNEFADEMSISNVASHTIWWEGFNKRNPNFFLKEMTEYHYKEWHLRNLLYGTEKILVYNKDDTLSLEAKLTYEFLIEAYRESRTAKTIRDYLSLLKVHNLTRTKEVQDFLNGIF